MIGDVIPLRFVVQISSYILTVKSADQYPTQHPTVPVFFIVLFETTAPPRGII